MNNRNGNEWTFSETNENICQVKVLINICISIDRNENEIFEIEMTITELDNLETRISKLRNLTRQRNEKNTGYNKKLALVVVDLVI